MNLSVVFWIVGLLAVSIGVLLAAGARARARLKKQYPPIGRMIDMGGYRLHIHVEGEGTPTVVFEAGAGGLGLSWELVRSVVAKVTRVVVYDRAGLGWSEPGPGPRAADGMAEELHLLLRKANIPGPYILVGHSLGGPIARQYAVKYPQEVVGLVMVDSAHEQQMRHFPEPLVRMANSMKGMLGIMKLMSKTGLYALRPTLSPIGDSGHLSSELRDQMRGVMAANDSHAETLIAETESVFSAAIRPVSTLGDLPLIVIRHGQLDVNAVPPSLGPQVRDDYERAWEELQAEIASLSTRGRLVVAEKSGHNIIYDEPEIIVQAVLEILTTTRTQIKASQKEMALAE
jgi:pimeloyl-ACP methyl ester carboxylesterase